MFFLLPRGQTETTGTLTKNKNKFFFFKCPVCILVRPKTQSKFIEDFDL